MVIWNIVQCLVKLQKKGNYRTGHNESYSYAVYTNHIDVHKWDTLKMVETIWLDNKRNDYENR